MNTFKFYDSNCDKCGNWYTSFFAPPYVNNKKQAIAEMKKNGWGVVAGKTYCQNCH